VKSLNSKPADDVTMPAGPAHPCSGIGVSARHRGAREILGEQRRGKRTKIRSSKYLNGTVCFGTFHNRFDRYGEFMNKDRDSPFDSANQAVTEIHESVGASETAIEAGHALSPSSIPEPGYMTFRKRAPYKPMAERISQFATARLVREQSPGFRRLCALSRRFDETKKD
jgi:hypothetical protein